jgi:4-amino-4-deoxy-L-arabinose transferase-like glycosyltransferase
MRKSLKAICQISWAIDSGDLVYIPLLRKTKEILQRIFLERNTQILLIIFVLALFLRLLCLGMNPLVGLAIPDVIRILILGENLSQGLGYTLFDHPEEKVPPIYPLIICGAYLLGGVNYQSVIIPSIIIGSLTVIPVYLLGKQLSNDLSGLIAALFVAVNPVLWLFSGIPMTETIFVFFTLFALYFLSLEKEFRNQFMGGVFIGLAFLSRYAGILILFAVIFTLIFDIIKRKYNRDLLIGFTWIIIGFLIATFPWFLRNTLVFGTPMGIGFLELWRDPVAGGVSSQYSGISMIEYFQTHSALEIISRPFEGLIFYTAVSVFAVPITILVFAIPGVYFLGIKEKSYLFYVYFILHLLFYAWFPSRLPRYFMPLIPLISLLAGISIARFYNSKVNWDFFVLKRIEFSRILGGLSLITIVSINIYSILLLSSLTAANPTFSLNMIEPLTNTNNRIETQLIEFGVIPSPATEEYVKAAAWLKENAFSEAVVIARKPLVFYYFSRLKVLGFPKFHLNQTLEYAIVKSNVSYIVLDSMESDSREYLPDLYFETDIPSNFKLIYKVENPRTLIYYIEY